MDWEDVRLFLAIARSTTLSEASTQLGISHSTVSRRLSALESRLKLSLFRRGPEGYATTEAGRAVYDTALRMEAEFLALTRRLTAHETATPRVVRVSGPDVLIRHLASRLDGFRALAPRIVLDLQIENGTVDLDRSEAEIVLRASRAPAAHLVGKRVASTAWAVYAARSKRTLRWDDDELAWIGFGAELADLPVSRWMRENVAESRIAYRTNSTIVAQAYARGGLGAACLWCLAGDSDPELTRLGEPLSGVASDLWLLTHPDLQKSKDVQKVRTFLARVIRAERSRIEAGES
jgi:DNA-binding transcriptional LysR family regulator